MIEMELPIQKAGRIDAHHFKVWTAFMDREGLKYRPLAHEQSEKYLNRMVFLEINSKC
jgi:hypothetical protein